MGEYLVLLLLFATLAVLVTGVIVMGKGGEANLKYSNRLMSLRVILQGLVIFTLFALFMMGGK